MAENIFPYGMESLKEYIDAGMENFAIEIKKELAFRELNILTGFQKQFESMDKSVKELIFTHIPLITRFIDILNEIKLRDMEKLTNYLPRK